MSFRYKKNLGLLVFLGLFLAWPLEGFAQRAVAFKGWYEILRSGPTPQESLLPQRKEYFLLDADTLGVIWARYARDPLPADLEHLRNEPTVIAGFTDRDTLFLTLEANALVGDNFLALSGAEKRLELARAPGGASSDLAVSDKGLTFFKLGPARAEPEALEGADKNIALIH
jgi:hypothetical protein